MKGLSGLDHLTYFAPSPISCVIVAATTSTMMSARMTTSVTCFVSFQKSARSMNSDSCTKRKRKNATHTSSMVTVAQNGISRCGSAGRSNRASAQMEA